MTNTVSSATHLHSATASSSTPPTNPDVNPMPDGGILPNISSDERTAAAATAVEPSIPKQRKKRRWDQPDESLMSSGVVTPGMLSMSTVGYPSMATFSALSSSSMHANIQPPLMQLQNTGMVQKLNLPKIQEDLVIAREIVINDADPTMRYKLTKRQTQEEIQKCTGAVVITRGKYRPPNAVSDGEKPLYLHISSGAHLKETPERILAVDRAAAMVEDMLKQVMQPLSTCVYVGFDADPSLNIAARIRGPNDQYINHIINETGATVVLCGNGSGYLASAESEGPQLMHLFLSSNNQKSLEDARLLAENLLDTISRECGTTRVSSTKLYGAVPPPQQLLVGVPSSGLEMSSNSSTSDTLACSAAIPVVGTSISSVVAPEVTAAFPLGQVTQTGGLISPGCSQTNRLLYSQPISTACSSYSAYAGIYPQATPLQQVALALKQCSTMSSTVVPTTSGSGTAQQSYANTEKRPPQRRKFQESPTTFTALAESHQVSAEKKLDTALPVTTLKNRQPLASSHTSTSCASSRSMPPPPPKFPSLTPLSTSGTMLPPKSTSSSSVNGASEMNNNSNTPNLISVPDTLVKLMEYGDDDEEDDDDDDVAPDKNELDLSTNHPNRIAAMKPFWAA